jgi:hypothetical protein
MRFNEFNEQLFEAPLGPGLFKYQGTKKDRVPIFLQKIEDGTPFKVKLKDKTIDVVIDPAEYEKVSTWMQNPVGSLKLNTTDGMTIPLGAIVKTKEFGGEAAGRRERIEQDQIADIASDLEKAKNGQSSIPLLVGDRVVQAARVEKEKGTVNGKAPKSDMTVIDEQGNPVAWVSLKGRPFRWGGWTHLIHVTEVKNWLNRIKQETGTVLDPGQSYGLHISDDLKAKIVYGKQFGGDRGFSNVDCVLVGDVSVKKDGEEFKLSAKTIYTNGEMPQGDDEPYLVLRYMKDRPDAGFRNARAETNTKSEGRKVKWLNDDNDVTPEENPDIEKDSTDIETPPEIDNSTQSGPNGLPPEKFSEPVSEPDELSRLKTLAGTKNTQ